MKKSYFADLIPNQNPIFSEFYLAIIEPKERNRKSASLLHRYVFISSLQKWGRRDAWGTRVIIMVFMIKKIPVNLVFLYYIIGII